VIRVRPTLRQGRAARVPGGPDARQYRAGAVGFTELATAQREVMKASLELEDDADKRKAILQKLKANAEGTVEAAEAKSKAGLATQVDVLQAKALLLEVSIEILRAEKKGKPSK